MSYHPGGVIPVEAGIQKRKTMDARLRNSGMTKNYPEIKVKKYQDRKLFFAEKVLL